MPVGEKQKYKNPDVKIKFATSCLLCDAEIPFDGDVRSVKCVCDDCKDIWYKIKREDRIKK